MCKPVHQEVEFDVPPNAVCDAYLDSRRHSRFTGQSATMSKRVGGAFVAGDGYITGYNLELVPSRRIVQAWRASEWGPGDYSILRLELSARRGGSKLTVDPIGIPDDFRAGVDHGWHEFYWQPMRAYFGGRAGRGRPVSKSRSRSRQPVGVGPSARVRHRPRGPYLGRRGLRRLR
jgi:activator of HSP90 ATPase